MDFLKRILTIALCSILLVCACPTFSVRSEAAEVALTTEFLRSAIGYLSGYLVSKGYSIAQNSSFDVDSALEATFPVQYQIYSTFMQGLKDYSTVHKALLEDALNRAYNSGVFSISEELDNVLSNYFESITVNDSLQFGITTSEFYPYDSSETSSYDLMYVDSNLNPSPTYALTVDVSLSFSYLPVINYRLGSRNIQFIYLPTTPITSSSTINEMLNSSSQSTFSDGSGFTSELTTNSFYYSGTRYYYLVSNLSYNDHSVLQTFTYPDYLTGNDLVAADLANICSFLWKDGYYSEQQVWEASQLVDTSEKDILSSASEVDPETGAVSGGFTMYMRDWSLYQQILKQFSSGILSWTQAIKALGLSQVSADASPAEKETALDRVAYPDSTYDWFTTTTWDNGVTQTVKDEVATAHETELDIADELAETLNGGNDPSDDDKNKAGNAMLLATLLMYLGLWDPPGFDPENPGDPGIGDGVTTDPTKPNMLVETLTGMGVAGGFINDLWDSVGGSQGLGIIFTVGASFVVFSVIIGGSNYLGSLQSPDISNHVDISAERSRIPQNKVPLLTTSKKSRRRK